MHYLVATIYAALAQREDARIHFAAAWKSTPSIAEAALGLAFLSARTRERRRLLKAYLRVKPRGRSARRARAELARLERNR
jgi:hypothetical protein